ncbi:hypothetical protein ACWDKQ_27310 [Saccharopolyspora sp. NPDC000995]
MLIRSGGIAMVVFRRGGLGRRSVAGPATSSAIGFFVVVAGIVLAATVAWWSDEQLARFIALGVVVGGYGAAIRNAAGALVTAVLGWMLFNGFVVHSLGDLAWEGSSDAVRLAALAGAAVLGVLVGRAWAGAHERPEVVEAIPAPRTAAGAGPSAHDRRPIAGSRSASREGLDRERFLARD